MNCPYCGTNGRTGPYFNCGTDIRDDGTQSNACREIARLKDALTFIAKYNCVRDDELRAEFESHKRIANRAITELEVEK